LRQVVFFNSLSIDSQLIPPHSRQIDGGPSCLVLSLLNRDGSILNNNEINVVDVLLCYEGIIEIRSKQVTLEF